MRVLYLYAGTRRKNFAAWQKGLEPDTPLVGLNHLKQFGVDADFFENRLTEFLRRVSFNLTQLPALFVMRKYDAVFSGAGLLTLFIAKAVLRWKKPRWFIYNTYLSNLLKRNKKGVKAALIRKAITSADGVICPSTAQADYLREAGFDATRIFTIPYGIDDDFYLKPKLPPLRTIQERYLFSAGRDMGRDYRTLIEAVRGLPVKLVIGALPRNIPRDVPIPENVTIRYFPQVEMPSLFAHAEFVVIPSYPEDQLIGSDCSGQYVLLEAMACGTPVIITARSTRADHLTGGAAGTIVPPQDPQALRAAIAGLWANPAKTRAMGRRAQATVAKHFTTRRFAEAFARILLGARPGVGTAT